MGSARHSSFRRGVSVTSVLCATILAAVLCGEESESDRKNRNWVAANVELKVWAQLGKPVKGAKDYYEVTIFREATGKKSVRKERALLKIPSRTLLYKDVRIPLKGLKPKDSILVFGEPSKVSAIVEGAATATVDRQIRYPEVVLSGRVNDSTVNLGYKDLRRPKFKWCKAEVLKTSGGLLVTHKRQKHRVVMRKKVPILRRTSAVREDLKRKVHLRVFAREVKEPPKFARAADAKKDCYDALQMIVLDQRFLKTAYPLIWAE